MSACPPARLLATVAGVVLAAVATAGCAGAERQRPPSPAGPVIGFVYVGSTDDFGYNQATFEGTRAIQAACPGAGSGSGAADLRAHPAG